MVMATTHYSRVKDFAAADGRLALGAMLLKDDGGPTFRLMIPGVGESYGIDQAKRVFDGEFNQVIERANSLFDVKQKDLTDLLLEARARAKALDDSQAKMQAEMDTIRQARESAEEELRLAEDNLTNAKSAGSAEWRQRLLEEEAKLETALPKVEEKSAGGEHLASLRAQAQAQAAQLRLSKFVEPVVSKDPTPLGKEPVPAGQELVYLLGPYKGRRVTCVSDNGRNIMIDLGGGSAFSTVTARRKELAIPPGQVVPASKEGWIRMKR
jgi:dsDNA-specific endonuclease/ATPase MutS2